ncbi:MAG: 2-C-methyl-D-erythritol 2,4-cyclodiphosphate synthase [Muribaculaceae bacterium]|nr:2-C-methyl-D-erythritol 2,4-cyclodiphosphate synthase [Muribaculaceae bacterium]
MIRIGNGFDVHRLVEGRKCIICGIEIPYRLGLLGHSDADVALHALCDALLGAAALHDIGYHFPDNDERWSGANSRILLRRVKEIIDEKGFKPVNVDVTIIAQAPKMLPYIDLMRQNIADDLSIDIDCVSVKATTTERLGFTGRGEGIAAQASALITDISPSDREPKP